MAADGGNLNNFQYHVCILPPFVSITTLSAPWQQRPDCGVKQPGKGWKGGEELARQADREGLKRPERRRKKGAVLTFINLQVLREKREGSSDEPIWGKISEMYSREILLRDFI